MLFTIVEAGFGHLFADAAFLDEVFFQPPSLLVEEVVGLVDEADEGVGPHRRIGVVEPTGVEGVAVGIGQIGLI